MVARDKGSIMVSSRSIKATRRLVVGSVMILNALAGGGGADAAMCDGTGEVASAVYEVVFDQPASDDYLENIEGRCQS